MPCNIAPRGELHNLQASGMRLASYIEAQLIRAEALGGAPQYKGATDAAAIRALVLDERNRELFMEGGHRYNDLLRFVTT